MYAASSLLIQVPINTLGTEAVAAWSATSKVDGVYFALMVSSAWPSWPLWGRTTAPANTSG